MNIVEETTLDLKWTTYHADAGNYDHNSGYS